MSYTGKSKYFSRRERAARTTRYIKIFLMWATLFSLVLLYRNRYIVKGWLESVFF